MEKKKCTCPSAPLAELTEAPCGRCLELAKQGKLRVEAVQRLPRGAAAPLARDGSGKCCFDCASADALVRGIGGMDFSMARIAVANDRQEQYRFPGMPMGLVKVGYVRPSQKGDLQKQHEWLERNGWLGINEETA